MFRFDHGAITLSKLNNFDNMPNLKDLQVYSHVKSFTLQSHFWKRDILQNKKREPTKI